MGIARTGCTLLLTSSLLIACAVEPTEYDDAWPELGITQQALGPCNETVPANRYIDGIPAYAQCDVTTNSAIFSNNGIDTSTTQMGSDWVRTQYSGGYQCTELAHRYLLFVWDITWLPRGNAGQWCDTQPPANSGMVQTTTPVHGDLMVLAGGSCGAAASTGHVVVVDKVEANGKLSVVEQNRANRGSYMPTCGKCFLHVVANDGSGTGGAGTAPPVGGGAPMGGAGGTGGTAGGGGTTPSGSAGMGMPMRPSQPILPPDQPEPKPPTTPPPSNAGAGGTVSPMPVVSTAGSGGSAAAAPSQIPIPLNSGGDDAGCSVAHIGGADQQHAGSGAMLFALALTALFTRAQRRRKP